MTDLGPSPLRPYEDVSYRFRAWDGLAATRPQPRVGPERRPPSRRAYWLGGAMVAAAAAVVVISLLMGVARILADADDTHLLATPGVSTVALDEGRFDIHTLAGQVPVPRVSLTGPDGERVAVTGASSSIESTIQGSEYQLVGVVEVAEPGTYALTATTPESATGQGASATGVAIGPSFDEAMRWVLLVIAGGMALAAALFAGGVVVLVRAVLAAVRRKQMVAP